MTTHKEALKLALEALEMFCEHGAILRSIETRNAIKEALEQQEGQSNYCLQCEALSCELAALKAQQSNEQVEPMAYLVYAKGSHRYFTLTFDIEKVPEIYKGGDVEPLYTHPPVPTAQPDPDKETTAMLDGRKWNKSKKQDTHGIKEKNT